MARKGFLFQVLGLEKFDNTILKKVAKEIGIPLAKLKYYDETNTVPSAMI